MNSEYHDMEEKRGRRGSTSPVERSNETGKVVIAHGSVEFYEATPFDLVIIARTRDGPRPAQRLDAWRDFYFYFSPNDQRRGVGGGYAAILFILLFFPCSANHEWDWPPCKKLFGLATNTLNVRNQRTKTGRNIG